MTATRRAADGPDYMRAVAANESRVLVGALFQCITAAAYVFGVRSCFLTFSWSEVQVS